MQCVAPISIYIIIRRKGRKERYNLPEGSKSTVLVALYSSASGSSLCPNMILHHLTFTSLKQLEVKTLAAAMLDHCWDNTVFVTQTRKAQAKRKPGTLVLDKIITISLKVQEKLLRSDRGHHSIKTKDLCPLRPQSGRSLLNM